MLLASQTATEMRNIDFEHESDFFSGLHIQIRFSGVRICNIWTSNIRSLCDTNSASGQ